MFGTPLGCSLPRSCRRRRRDPGYPLLAELLAFTITARRSNCNTPPGLVTNANWPKRDETSFMEEFPSTGTLFFDFF